MRAVRTGAETDDGIDGRPDMALPFRDHPPNPGRVRLRTPEDQQRVAGPGFAALRRLRAREILWAGYVAAAGVSKESPEVVRRGHDAFTEGDLTRVRATVADDVDGAPLRDDGDVLVIRERLRGRGRESGAEVDMRISSVYWFEAGRIVERRAFAAEAESLEAADVRS